MTRRMLGKSTGCQMMGSADARLDGRIDPNRLAEQLKDHLIKGKGQIVS